MSRVFQPAAPVWLMPPGRRGGWAAGILLVAALSAPERGEQEANVGVDRMANPGSGIPKGTKEALLDALQESVEDAQFASGGRRSG